MKTERGLKKFYPLSLLAAALCLFSYSGIRAAAGEPNPSHQLYGDVLRLYVKDGLVDYGGLKSSSKDLDAYLKYTASVTREEFDTWNEARQLAFLINLYNAQTLNLVIEHYPVAGIKEIYSESSGPWEKPVVSLFGKDISLNDLENEYIRKNYNEPRIHFALMCAAKGCPPLLDEPFTALELDAQLESQTRRFLADSEKNSIDTENKVIHLSPVFDWFGEDFSAKSGSVRDFLRPYYGSINLEGYRIEYTNYDWSLNDTASQHKSRSFRQSLPE